MTLAELAAACGLSGPSAFQKYVDPKRRTPVPVHIVRSIESVLVDRGSPPIAKRELWEQVANIPDIGSDSDPASPKITTAALQLAEAMGFKMKDHETAIILDGLKTLQRLGRSDLSTEEAVQALKRIAGVIDRK